MKYNIFIDTEFKESFNNAYIYIRHKLRANTAAKKLEKSMHKCILNLGTIPKAYPRLNNLKHNNQPLRFCPCDNYLIIFTVVGKNVYVLNFVYSKSEKYKLKYKEDNN